MKEAIKFTNIACWLLLAISIINHSGFGATVACALFTANLMLMATMVTLKKRVAAKG